MSPWKLTALVLLAAGLGGCGTASPPGAAHNAQVISAARQGASTEQAVRRAFLRLPDARVDKLGGIEWLAPGESPEDLSVDAACSVGVILASPAALAIYQGDPNVVLNPSGTIGVKVQGTDQYQAACLQEAAGAQAPALTLARAR